MNKAKRFIKYIKTFSAFTIMFCIVFTVLLSVALATNILVNGNFNTDLNTWSINGQDGYTAPQANWKASGYTGTIISDGNVKSAQGGAVQLHTGIGAGLERKGYLRQSFSVTQKPSAAKLSFAWKKTWVTKKPSKHDLRVYLVVPGGTVYELWYHTTVATVSDNGWYKVEDLDISNYFTTTGTYEIRLHTWLKNGSEPTAEADAWYDEVILDFPGQTNDPPSIPTGLAVENGGSGSELLLSWQANVESDLAGYNIYRSADNITFSKINSSLITDITYSDSGLIEGNKYYYRISSQDTAGLESNPSTSIEGTPNNTNPAPPTGLNVQNPGNGGELDIVWNVNKETDIAGYNLYRSLDNITYQKLNPTLILDTSWKDSSLINNQIYYYKVSAVDLTSKESSLSGASSETPSLVQTGPGILKNSKFLDSLSGWQLSGPIARAKGVLTATPAPDFVYEASGYTGTLSSGTSSYTGTGGASKLVVSGSSKIGRGHIFQRIYFKPTGSASLSFVWKKNYSSSAPTEQTARVILIKPDGVPVKIWENITISNANTWQKVENLDLTTHMMGDGSYQLEFWAHIKNGSTIDASGSIFYDEVIFNVGKAPLVPIDLRVTPITSGGAVKLQWANNSEANISGYKIWRSTDGTNYSLITPQPVIGIEYQDGGLINGQRYYYKISAVDQGGGESPQTRPIKVNPRIVPDPRYDAHTGYIQFTDSCKLCHFTHSGQAPRLLNRDNEEALCFTCHDGMGSIFNMLPDYTGSKVSYHPVKNTELSPSGKLSCSSCHDPHDATGSRTAPLNATGSIQGSLGVNVNYNKIAFTQPTMTMKSSINNEYEQCLLCHSNNTGGIVQSTIQDTAKEFNPNNLSYHSSVGKSKATGFGLYVDGWLANMPIFCVDCHGSNNNNSPEGPHSSGNNDILKLAYSANPLAPQTNLCFSCHGSTSHGNGGGADYGTLFASRGSDPSKGYANFEKNLHNSPGGHKSAGCAVCHASLPHGFNRRAMLVVPSDPAPYGQYAKNTMIDYPTDGNWQYNSCATVTECH